MHIVDEAFVPLVLLSTGSATAIISGVLLSIFWLKEVFVWQYDVTAITIIICGAITMVLLADKQNDNFTY